MMKSAPHKNHLNHKSCHCYASSLTLLFIINQYHLYYLDWVWCWWCRWRDWDTHTWRGSFCRSVVEPGTWWDAEQRVCSDSRDTGGRREEARRGRTVQLTSGVRGGAAATRSSVIISRAVWTCSGGCVSAIVLCMQRQTCQPEHGLNRKVKLFADLENHEPWTMRYEEVSSRHEQENIITKLCFL